MKNSMYSSDILWYDPAVKSAIERLDAKYPNAIPVFGGALSASKYLSEDNYDLAKFISFLPQVADNAKFFGWEKGVINALKTFCHICFVDPALIEVYLGATFEEVFV